MLAELKDHIMGRLLIPVLIHVKQYVVEKCVTRRTMAKAIEASSLQNQKDLIPFRGESVLRGRTVHHTYGVYDRGRCRLKFELDIEKTSESTRF